MKNPNIPDNTKDYRDAFERMEERRNKLKKKNDVSNNKRGNPEQKRVA